MSSKGRNQFSDFHPNAGKREYAAREVAKEKGELHASKHPEGFGAPHFPASEKLPPPAKRVAYQKRQKQEHRERERALHEPPGAHREEEAARVHAAGEQVEAGQLPPEKYPDAAPRPQDSRAAIRETIQRVEKQAEPVLTEAKGHWSRAVEAAARFFAEARELLQVPAVLMRVLLDARKQA